RAVRTRESPEVVIEGVVLLDDENDVVDLAQARLPRDGAVREQVQGRPGRVGEQHGRDEVNDEAETLQGHSVPLIGYCGASPPRLVPSHRDLNAWPAQPGQCRRPPRPADRANSGPRAACGGRRSPVLAAGDAHPAPDGRTRSTDT